MHEELLTLENLSIQYKVKDGYLSAVNGISCTINKGEVFAIVGESGCGKSTVAHSIMKLLPGNNAEVSGKIDFKGKNLLDFNEEEIEKIRGKEIGMIFQNTLDSLHPVYNVGVQVAQSLELDHASREASWQKVIELFKSVKMPDAEERAHSFPHELSGGMRQRVMIAMMISRNPDLLIADEPTTALDVTIEAQILEIMRELKEKNNTAIMLITHNFGLVAEIADRIGIMYAGEMVEIGDVYEIFENPKHPYTKLLMQALPRKTKAESRLKTISGSVPRITEIKNECRFSNRCPYAEEICHTQVPPVVQVADDHMCRCHLLRKEVK